MVKVKVKLKEKVNFTLEEATKVQRWSRSIALFFLYPRREMGWEVNATPRPLYPLGRPVTHCIGGWLGTVWTGAGNLAPTGIRSPDRPARNESLQRLRYPCPQYKK